MADNIGRVLLIGSGLWFFGEGLLGPFFSIFAQRIGGDILEISWAWATYLLVMGILTIVLGRYSDKMKKEKLMLAGYALNAFFTFCYLLVSSPLSLFLVQVGLGLAAALATPTWDALYAKCDNRNSDGAAWGLADGMPHIVTAVSTVIGGVVLNYFSFSILFASMGVLQIIATVYQANILYFSCSYNSCTET